MDVKAFKSFVASTHIDSYFHKVYIFCYMHILMRQAKTAIIPYLNVDHSDVPTKTWLRMTKPDGDLEVMCEAIHYADIPIVWSTQGIDLDLLHKRNPGLLQDLSTDPNITFTGGIYTHALPSFHPETLDLQLAYAKQAFYNNKIASAPIGMFPEFDVPSGLIGTCSSKGVGWSYILLQNSVNQFYDHRLNYNSTELPQNCDLVTIKNALGQSIRGIVTQGPAPRDAFLKMLRGYVSPADMVDCLVEESVRAGERGSPLMAFLIDLESVQINQTEQNPAMQYFIDYVQELDHANKSGKLPLTGFDSSLVDLLDEHFKDSNVPTVTLNTRKKPKWLISEDEYNITDRLKSIPVHDLPPYHQLTALAAQVSDLHSAQASYRKAEDGVIVRLPIKLPNGEVIEKHIPIGGDKNRISEVRHLVEVVERELLVIDNSSIELSSASKEKMQAFHNVFSGY